MKNLIRDMLRYLFWRYATRHERLRAEIETDGASIHYQMVGEGPVVVLLHGGLSSSIDWYLILPALSKHFSVVLIDFRGHGRSTLDERELNYALYGRDVIAVMDTLGITQFDIVGWSDGGNVGLWLAYTQPERIVRLVAISANTRHDGLTDAARALIGRIQSTSTPMLSKLLHSLRSRGLGVHWSNVKPRVARLWKTAVLLTPKQLETINAQTLMPIKQSSTSSLRMNKRFDWAPMDQSHHQENIPTQYKPRGIWGAVLLPINNNGEIDWPALEDELDILIISIVYHTMPTVAVE